MCCSRALTMVVTRGMQPFLALCRSLCRVCQAMSQLGGENLTHGVAHFTSEVIALVLSAVPALLRLGGSMSIL
jgi:hypothetical protein